MFTFNSDEVNERNLINSIKEAQRRFDDYDIKVKDMEHIRKLLYIDLVKSACAIKSKYCYCADIIEKAWEQQHNKKKKDRKDFEYIKALIVEDFFNNNKDVKIVEIIGGGHEHYLYDFHCKYRAIEFIITIPITQRINVDNFEYANKGQFSLSIGNGKHYSERVASSYRIEDIVTVIKIYIQGEN